METDRLKQFCAVVDTGSLSKASQILGITLSGLSRSLQILQHQVGYELFRPQGRGILITDSGHELFQKAKIILSQVHDLSNRHSNNSNGLRIGCLEVFSFNLMGRISDNLRKRPQAIIELPPKDLESRIFDGRLDFGLTYLPISMDSIEHIPIVDFQNGIFKKKGAFESIPVDETPFIVPDAEFDVTPMGIKARDGWPENLWERKVALRVNLLSTALDFVHRGAGAIYMPTFVADIYNQSSEQKRKLEQVPIKSLKKSNHVKLFLAKRIGTSESDEMKELISVIKRSLKSV
jgi:DNA-binding transcriptional LysR family regulator